MGKAITSHTQLKVYHVAFDTAMQLTDASKQFPKVEMYSLTDQIRRSSRSVAGNLAEGWRRRRYRAAFVSKLNESEAEAGETQSWIEFAVRCGYIDRALAARLYKSYDEVLAMLVAMIRNPDPWILRPETRN
jgi:four helix bundle protein